MKKILIAHKNLKAGFYSTIALVPTDNIEELKEALIRDIASISKEEFHKIKDIETYALGIFDDNTAKLVLFEEKEFIISTNDYGKE